MQCIDKSSPAPRVAYKQAFTGALGYNYSSTPDNLRSLVIRSPMIGQLPPDYGVALDQSTSSPKSAHFTNPSTLLNHNATRSHRQQRQHVFATLCHRRGPPHRRHSRRCSHLHHLLHSPYANFPRYPDMTSCRVVAVHHHLTLYHR